MFGAISNAIYNILVGLIPTTTLASVFNYDVKTYDVVPCATVSPQDTIELGLDTITNMDTIDFRIRIVDKNRDVANMEARMRTLIDNIIAELRKKSNITLGGLICNMTFEITWGWLDDDQPMRTCEITCKCLTTNTII